MKTAQYPALVNDDGHLVIYEFSWELPAFDDRANDSVHNEHSLNIQLSHDRERRVSQAHIFHEVNGCHTGLGGFEVGNDQFQRVTGHKFSMEDRLADLLARVIHPMADDGDVRDARALLKERGATL